MTAATMIVVVVVASVVVLAIAAPLGAFVARAFALGVWAQQQQNAR